MNPITSDTHIDSSMVSVLLDCKSSRSLIKDPSTERMGTAMGPVTVDDSA